ncbi:MAG: S8/S53 family peptidase [Bdellovibrionales bacterium]
MVNRFISLFLSAILGTASSPAHCGLVIGCEETNPVTTVRNLEELTAYLSKENIRECLYPESQGDTKPDLWAQEMVGADLVREEVKDLRPAVKNLALVGVLDIDFNLQDKAEIRNVDPDSVIYPGAKGKGHGFWSMLSIGGPSPYSFGNFSRPRYVDGNGPAGQVFSSLSDPKVQLVNMSISMSPFSKHRGKEKELIMPNKVQDDLMLRLRNQKPLVLASGNAFDENGEAHLADAFHDNIIMVGSLSPRGLAREETNKSKAVTVMAPSDFLVSRGITYSGTSGATTVVNSALGDVIAMLGSMSGKELKAMIRNTSTPIPSLDSEPLKHGAGVINHYKLFRVAEKLRKNSAWLKGRKIEDNIYDFSIEAKRLETEAFDSLKEPTCSNLKTAYKKLRRAFLLRPTDENRFVLAEIHKSMGYEETEQFFRNKTEDWKNYFIKEFSSRASPEILKRDQLGLPPDLKRYLSYDPTAQSAYEEAVQRAEARHRIQTGKSRETSLPSNKISTASAQTVPSMMDAEIKYYEAKKLKGDRRFQILTNARPCLQAMVAALPAEENIFPQFYSTWLKSNPQCEVPLQAWSELDRDKPGTLGNFAYDIYKNLDIP